MPERAHVLVWPTENEYDVSDLLKPIKQSVSKRALMHVRRHAPEVLAPEDSSWSIAADDSNLRTGPLRLDRESLPIFLGNENDAAN